MINSPKPRLILVISELENCGNLGQFGRVLDLPARKIEATSPSPASKPYNGNVHALVHDSRLNLCCVARAQLGASDVRDSFAVDVDADSLASAPVSFRDERRPKVFIVRSDSFQEPRARVKKGVGKHITNASPLQFLHVFRQIRQRPYLFLPVCIFALKQIKKTHVPNYGADGKAVA